MSVIADIIAKGALEYGIPLPFSAGDCFSAYAAWLEKRGRIVNLTAIEGAEDIARLHFLDSLALLTVCDFSGSSVIDIGSGAGFPGLPMKLAVPDISLTLLDAQRKRVDFLRELCDILGLDGVKCVHARAEESARLPEMRGAYDYAVSRAVARLNVLCELCLPFVHQGGAFVAMKSVESDEEIREASNAMSLLGASLESTLDYTIPGTHIRHRAVLVRKTSVTPDKFPRRFARIEKTPL